MALSYIEKGRQQVMEPLTTSAIYSINISSMTATVSLEGFRSSPKPYIKLFVHIAVQDPETRKEFMEENLKSEYESWFVNQIFAY